MSVVLDLLVAFDGRDWCNLVVLETGAMNGICIEVGSRKSRMLGRWMVNSMDILKGCVEKSISLLIVTAIEDL